MNGVGFSSPEVWFTQSPGFASGVGTFNTFGNGVTYDMTPTQVNVYTQALLNGDVSLSSALDLNYPGEDLIRFNGPGYYVGALDNVALNQTIHRWSNGTQFVQMIVSESGPDRFNVCLNMETPRVKRLQCNTFNRQPVEWSSAYIFDDVGGRIYEYRSR